MPYTSIKGTLPNRFVMDFAVSATNDDSVFVVLGGFGTSHVYATGDGGSTWTDVGTGLPDVPFNAVLIDRVNPEVIYAGCDFGVFVRSRQRQYLARLQRWFVGCHPGYGFTNDSR
ncbi:MAG: hypothetical protein IPH18_06015 [Chitinophagaceae bacterium]|nr:hypothetical protein [Chitinophagaceae bacterium]